MDLSLLPADYNLALIQDIFLGIQISNKKVYFLLPDCRKQFLKPEMLEMLLMKINRFERRFIIGA